jgi:hypothetical protein
MPRNSPHKPKKRLFSYNFLWRHAKETLQKWRSYHNRFNYSSIVYRYSVSCLKEFPKKQKTVIPGIRRWRERTFSITREHSKLQHNNQIGINTTPTVNSILIGSLFWDEENIWWTEKHTTFEQRLIFWEVWITREKRYLTLDFYIVIDTIGISDPPGLLSKFVRWRFV